MPRSLVYASGRRPPDRERFGEGGRAGELPADGYLDKLVKYIPAEVIAFFTPIAAFIGSNEGPIAVIAALGAVGTVMWTYGSAIREKVPRDQRPRWYSYVIAVLAYAAWALGISVGLRELFDLSDEWAGVILAAAVLLLPGFDLILSSRATTGQ
jgi:hypothetical protein